MISCPRCQSENVNDARFCFHCQMPLSATQTRTCAQGHLMDPSWTECVYCQSAGIIAANALHPPTRLDSSIGTPAPAAIPARPGPAAPVPGARRKTIFVAPGADARQSDATSSSAASDRRIVGVLVTHSWNPSGQVFPIREGRNVIGRNSDCDISLPDDPSLSGFNSHITFRRSFVLGDMVSMGGTYLNGEPVERQFVPLPNNATVRTGSTTWTFVSIIPTALESTQENSNDC